MRKKIFFLLIISSFIYFLGNTNAVDVILHINVVNSFSGTVSITGSNIFTKNNIIYTDTENISAQITSDSSSSYTISGDLQTNISGNQSQPYTIQTNITLNKINNINYIFPVFWKGFEKLTHETLQIYIDKIAPTKPTILAPTQNTLRNGPTIIKRTESIDNGGGLDEYIVLISTDQNFATTIYFQSTLNDEQYLNTSIFPEGKLYLKIFAKDKVNNISESDTIIVCNKKSCTTPPPNGGGGRGGSTYNPPSQPTTNIQRITIIENLEEKQKIEPKEEPTIGFISNILYDQELLDAYKYAYGLGITTMPSAYQANLKGTLIRKDLAKMISEYALKIVKKVPDNRLICNFDDLNNETLEIRYYTKLACKLGLMGRQADGNTKLDDFMPNEAVNRAQFGTVLSRTIFGEKNNPQSGENYERYQKHLLALNENKIMKIIDLPWMVELRGRVMLTMMRADTNNQIQHASAK